jgi:hypothetical protein
MTLTKTILVSFLTNIITLMVFGPIIFYIGPSVEVKLFPVNDITPTDLRVVKKDDDKYELHLRFRSNKFRPCKLDSIGWRWYFGDVVEPAKPIWADTGEDWSAGTAITTGPSLSRPIKLDIPEVAYSHPDLQMRAQVFYACHGLWLLPIDPPFVIAVHMPAQGDKMEPVANAVRR